MDDILPGITLPDIAVTGRERAEYLRSAIRVDVSRFINAGASANQAYEAYQAEGMGINRQQFLGIFREEKAYLSNLSSAANLTLDDTIADSQRDVSPYRIDTNFRERAWVSIYDRTQDTVRRIVFNLDHDDDMSVGEILESVRDQLSEETNQSYQWDVLAVSLIGSYISGAIA